jgi:hypothetical protein
VLRHPRVMKTGCHAGVLIFLFSHLNAASGAGY